MKYCPLCAKTYEDHAEFCEIDGATLRVSGPKQDTWTDKLIKGRYRVVKKLGEGGMGTVYLAEQVAISRKVALKILHPDYARDEEFLRRFRQEARLAASLNHRNVVTVFDFDQADDGSLYIVMEYVDGRSLSEVIRNNPMDISGALQLGIQIADGLGAAHRAGVIHRDIKPENIMVVEAGKEIKLMDFGIARLRDSAAGTRLTRSGMIMGTPAYMAPEQIEGGDVSERTDIYAFGIVLYEMLTGRVPFTATTPGAILIKHLNEPPVPLRKVRKEIPPSVEGIVSQALQKIPEKRLRSMEAVVEALKKAQQEAERHPIAGVTPPMVAVRQKLGAVATPFRKLFERASSSREVPKRDDREVVIQDQQPRGDQPAKDFETSVRPETSGRIAEVAPRTVVELSDVSRVDIPAVGAGLQKSEAVLEWPRQPEKEENVAGMLAQTSTSPAVEMIAETAAVTRPVEKVKTGRRGWIVAASVGAVMVLIGIVGGVTVYLYLQENEPIQSAAMTGGSQESKISTEREAISTPPIIEKERMDVQEPATVKPPTESPGVRQKTWEGQESRRKLPSGIAVPEVKSKENSPAKAIAPKEAKTGEPKPIEKAPTPAEPVKSKKTDPEVFKETEAKEQVKATKPDRERKGGSEARVEVEKTTKSDRASKELQEQSEATKMAALKREVPQPLPQIRLMDLSVLADRREIKVKERLVLTVKGKYSDGKENEIPGGVRWESSDATVATVNSRGELEAFKEGKTQIRATYAGVTSPVYTFQVKGSPESQKVDKPEEGIQDMRRRLLR